MKASVRGEAPSALTTHGAKWTESWVTRCATGTFFWPQHDGEKLNHILLPALRAMTQEHCAYCDSQVLELEESIDHFRPKAWGAFPERAFEWPNLFFACPNCQKQKLAAFEPLTLKPDEDGYSFDKYFVYRIKGDIEPRPGLAVEEERRARATIEFLGLNKNGLPAARERELRKRSVANDELAPHEWQFRFAWAD